MGKELGRHAVGVGHWLHELDIDADSTTQADCAHHEILAVSHVEVQPRPMRGDLQIGFAKGPIAKVDGPRVEGKIEAQNLAQQPTTEGECVTVI